MGSIANGVAGFAVSLGLAWGLILFGELPPDVVPATFAQTILNAQYVWAAKIWFLTHHVLLDAQLELTILQVVVLGVLPWFVCGVTAGMLSRGPSKGFSVGLFAGVLSILVSLIVLFLSPLLGIVLPGDGQVTAWVNNPLQYLISLLSIQTLVLCATSGAGGALGGILTRQKQ